MCRRTEARPRRHLTSRSEPVEETLSSTPEPSLTRMLAEHGQEHLLRFWDQLGEPGRAGLKAQLESLDLDLVDRLIENHVRSEAPPPSPPTIEPAEVIGVPGDETARRAAVEAREAGEALLSGGKVAVLTVAGGQGSRLGFDGPKGAFSIGPVSRMTLFEVFARTIRSIRRRYRALVPWLIMTSETNHADTVAFFQENRYFDLSPSSIRFFTQGMVPSVDFEGKMLLAAPDRVAVNPDGHGGTLLALRDSGALEDLLAAGTEEVFYFQVDNPLAVIADPVFLGYHRLHGADMSSKAVEKTRPEERVGVIVRMDGNLGVIEYSNLNPEAAREQTPDGALRYAAGSIAIHAFSVDFIDRITSGGLQLPFHKAVKKVPHVDPAGKAVKPEKPNAVKFETYVFDALGQARNPVTMMVPREDEFSPVKNAEGEDSVATAQRDMANRAGRWLEGAGVKVPRDADGNVSVALEIDPGFALDAEELKNRLPADIRVEPGLYLTC